MRNEGASKNNRPKEPGVSVSQGSFHKITLPAPGETSQSEKAAGSRISTGGYFDNSLPPVLLIKSGDTVAIETGTHLMGRMVPGVQAEEWVKMYKEEMAQYPGTYFYPDPSTGVEKMERRPNHTHLTGPIYVEDAEPGDILQVEILEIVPKEHGFNINPEPSFMKQGLLADDFHKGRVKWYRVDLERNNFEFLPGVKLPLRPFPGTLGVQLPEPGRYANVPPGKHAGNLDCKELIAGTVLYMPVWVKGAGLVTGDAHLAQGDGEVNVSALEGAFRNITLRITARKDLGHKVDWPFISTPEHWITLGFNTNLHEACKMAVQKAIRFLKNHYGMPEDDAYAFCSMGADLRVTQVANFAHGIHAMIPKHAFVGEEYLPKNNLLL
ncbi:MAG: acetamidase/formamidase family protein [Syntrophorhabdaceae bacterium]|nr:acetamidase/formamidase family protein [Syntrophorhabdaceae bacterium]